MKSFLFIIFICLNIKQDVKKCDDSGLRIKYHFHLTANEGPLYEVYNLPMFNTSRSMHSILCKNNTVDFEKIQTIDSLMKRIQWVEITEDTLISRYPREYQTERYNYLIYYENRKEIQKNTNGSDYKSLVSIVRRKDIENIDSVWYEELIKHRFCEMITTCTFKFEYFDKKGVQDTIFLGGRFTNRKVHHGYKFTKGKFYQTIDHVNDLKLNHFLNDSIVRVRR